MIEMRAVVQVPAFDAESPPPWPVAPMAAGSWLELTAEDTDRQVGLFVAALARPLDVALPGVALPGVALPGGRDEVADTLLAEEFLIVPGGLRLLDTITGSAVVPGCCAGLEDWRDWLRVAAGESPWLGHDPGPEAEIAGDTLRVWQDGPWPARGPGRRAGTSVSVPRLALPDLLRDVRRDLLGFLDALRTWTTRIGLGERGDALVEAVDRNFAIAAPLDLAAD